MNGANSDSHEMTRNDEIQMDLASETSKIEREALDRKIKLGKAGAHVESLIHNLVKSGSTFLDLSKVNIYNIPEELFQLPQITNLYLEGNSLTILPEDFFQKLPSLKWLDLRNNQLVSLPSAYIGSHKCLSHLLLQGNKLQTLPLELGQVRTLEGLSLGANPLKFPPQDIIEKGVIEILNYLEKMLLSKSNGSFKPVYRNSNGVSASFDDSESDENSASKELKNSKRFRERPQSAKSDSSELTGKTVSLYKQRSYQDLRRDRMAKINKAGASGTVQKKINTTSSTKVRSANLFPEPPSIDVIDMKVKENQFQAISRERNEKIEAILQRRKDEEKLRQFREDAKLLQQKKDYEKYMNGGKLDFMEPGKQAPFDVAEEDMKVITNEERIKKGVREQHERIRQVLSPRALKQIEQQKVAKEKEVRQKIKDHTESMKTRRKKPKGNPQEEMSAALRELEIAKRLQHELDQRKRTLEYRFRAYNPPF